MELQDKLKFGKEVEGLPSDLVHKTGNETIAGLKTFTEQIAYDGGTIGGSTPVVSQSPNTFTKTGIQSVNSGQPDSPTSGNYNLLTIGYNGNRLSQLAMGIFENRLWFRAISSTIGAWLEIYHSGNIAAYLTGTARTYTAVQTHSVSPVVPTATDPTHAVPLSQVEEIAAASGGSSGSVESFMVSSISEWRVSTGNLNWHIDDGSKIMMRLMDTPDFITAISSGNNTRNHQPIFIAPFNCKIISAEFLFYTATGRTFEFAIGSYTYVDNNLGSINPVILHQETFTQDTTKQFHKVVTPSNAIVNAGDSLVFGLKEASAPNTVTIPISFHFYIQKV